MVAVESVLVFNTAHGHRVHTHDKTGVCKRTTRGQAPRPVRAWKVQSRRIG